MEGESSPAELAWQNTRDMKEDSESQNKDAIGEQNLFISYQPISRYREEELLPYVGVGITESQRIQATWILAL